MGAARDPSRDLADAYLDDLGLGRRPPSIDALTEIVRRHIAQYSFASIGPRLGNELPIEPDALLDRIVVRRRGGYCFEQNGLLFAVLEQLGYPAQIGRAHV